MSLSLAVATAYGIVTAFGVAHAVVAQHHCRLFGWRWPGSVRLQAATLGTAHSAPPMMVVVMVWAAAVRARNLLTILSALAIVGVLAEPDTYSTLKSGTVGSRALAAGLVVVPIVLIAVNH